MRAGSGEESTASRGATSRNDGLHSFNGGGDGNGGVTQTQGLSAGPGGTQSGDDRDVTKAPWFTPLTDDSGCKDGICPVPWLTVEPLDLTSVLPATNTVKEDVVNHPHHYTAAGTIECIEAIESQLTREEFRGYLKGNITKYNWRERNKGGTESLKKAQWYLNRLVEFDESQV
jgi:hypothetical protein